MMPQPHPAHMFWGKEEILEKLPPLGRRDWSAPSSSRPQSLLSTQRVENHKMITLKDWEQESPSPEGNWHYSESHQGRHRSATARRRTDPEEKSSDIFKEKSEMDSIFPMKPVCHKRAFNLNNCHANDDYFTQKDRKRLDYSFPCPPQGKNRSRLQSFDSEFHQESRKRGENNAKATNGYQELYEHQFRFPEKQIQMTKEIQRKEIILQEKLLKAEEELRKIHLRAGSRDKDKREERNKVMEKAELYPLYGAEKGDWESARDRAIGGRRNEGQKERVRDWGRGNKHDTERRKMDMEEGYRERRKEGTDWENRKNTRRPTDYNRKNEWDRHEDITVQKWDIVKMKKDKIKHEKSLEWHWREWQEKERGNDGQRRGERVHGERGARDMEKEWNIIDAFKSNSQGKLKENSRHDKMNASAVDWRPTQERGHQTTGGIRRGQPGEPSTERAPQTPHLNQRHQHLISERGPDASVQLVSCKICHRCFLKDRLERHSRICEKQHKSKREAFNSAQYRAKGTDLETFMKTNIQRRTPEVSLRFK